MGKISAFLIGTIGLSLAMLIPLYLSFQRIFVKTEELGLGKVFPNFWLGFALIVFVVLMAVGTLMALIIFGGENDVVR